MSRVQRENNSYLRDIQNCYIQKVVQRGKQGLELYKTNTLHLVALLNYMISDQLHTDWCQKYINWQHQWTELAVTTYLYTQQTHDVGSTVDIGWI